MPQDLFLACGEPMPHALDALNAHLDKCHVCQYELGPGARKGNASPQQSREIRATKTLVKHLAALRDMRDAGKLDDILFICRYLMIISLPYKKTDQRQITKSFRLPSGARAALTLTAANPKYPLPYGADRTLFHWLIDRVIRQLQHATKHMPSERAWNQARLVEWQHASEYLREMGLSDGADNYKRLRGAWLRLANFVISIDDQSDQSTFDAGKLIPLAEDYYLPKSISASKQNGPSKQLRLFLSEMDLAPDDMRFGVLFSPQLAPALLKGAVPVPREILIRSRKRYQLQDYILFLSFRAWRCRKPTLIPWPEIREQLWHADLTTRRVRVRMHRAIIALRVIWREFQAEARHEGLWIAPARGGVTFLKGARRLRQIED